MGFRRWQRLWKRRVVIPFRGRFAPEVTTDVFGRQMRVDLRDYPIGQTLYLDGSFEPELQDLMRHLELDGSLVLDIGANIGLHTLAMSELVGEGGHVYAFEPEEHNFQLLKENLRINHATNVVVDQAVVSDRMGACAISRSPVNFGDHRISDLAPASWETQEVSMTTIDAATEQLPDNAIRFIKIDVQGHEMSVLRGMKKTLDRNPDAIIVLEVQPDLLANAGSTASELMETVRAWDFSGWELHEHRVVPISEPWVYDLLSDQSWVNVVISRNNELLRKAMSRYCGTELPAK